jgi:PilZ domain
MRDERRRWPRRTYAGGRLPPSARIRPGDIVTLVDLSSGGALVESGLRLRWGTRCDFEWTIGDGVISVAARVIRCFVARLEASAVRYRTALRFEAPVAQPPEQDLLAEYQVPGGFARISADGVVTARLAGLPRPSSAGRPRNVARAKDLTWHRP